ncbi:MAG TPA: hypothetical protein V6C89_00375 [Drouetiella sp.]|jgi:hypothetical protein
MSKAIDIQQATNNIAQSDKYEPEASQIKSLIQDHKLDEATTRLQLDAHLAPHELHKLMDALKKDCASVPDCQITDNGSGISVKANIEQSDGSKKERILLEKSNSELAKAQDKLPKTGDLLGLNAEQTREILDIQAAEKQANGGKSHKFGDIAVSLGYSSPEDVNAALRLQDRMAAEQSARDMSRLLPLATGEGYYQVLKRTHPELSDGTASQLATHMREINGNQVKLPLAAQLALLTEREKDKLADQLYEQRVKTTGEVKSTFKQPLDQISF